MARIWRNGKYWHCYGYYPDGKKWKASTRQARRSDAEKAARSIEKEKLESYISGDVQKQRELVTLGDALELLDEAQVRKQLSHGTRTMTAYAAANLTEYFGADLDISTLKLSHTEGYVDHRRSQLISRDGRMQPISDHTILKEINVLKGALRVCQRHQLWSGDVGMLAPAALRGAYTPRSRWLTVTEYRDLLRELPDTRQRYVIAYCQTGVRAGELYRSRVEGDVLLVDQRKGQRQTREIPLSEDAQRVFAEHGQPSTWPVWGSGARTSQLLAASERAGIPRVSANDFRRTFCSWLCQAGVPELTVIKLMGHTSSRMVRMVYGQLAPETLRAAVDCLPTLGKVRDLRGETEASVRRSELDDVRRQLGRLATG